MELMDSKSLNALQQICEEESSVDEYRKRIDGGDFTAVEKALINQAQILGEVFEIYVEKMITTEYHESQKIFAGIALKSQSQCRKTLQALVELKSPKKLTFIKQQNNAQINVNQEKNNNQTSGDS